MGTLGAGAVPAILAAARATLSESLSVICRDRADRPVARSKATTTRSEVVGAGSR